MEDACRGHTVNQEEGGRGGVSGFAFSVRSEAAGDLSATTPRLELQVAVVPEIRPFGNKLGTPLEVCNCSAFILELHPVVGLEVTPVSA